MGESLTGRKSVKTLNLTIDNTNRLETRLSLKQKVLQKLKHQITF